MKQLSSLVSHGVKKAASAGGAFSCLVLALTILIAQRVPIVSGDTYALANSSGSLVECLRNHQWLGCPGATQFGVTQYLPAVLLSWRGMSPDGIVISLALINSGSFILLCWIIWKFPLRHLNSRLLMMLCVICSPIIAYASFSFGEGLVGFLVAASLYAVCTKNQLLYLISIVGVVASKESAVVSIVPIIIAVYLVTPRDRRLTLKRIAIGWIIGAGVLIGFNYFKFGTWRNPVYADPSLRVSGVQRRIELFLGELFSPNGGLFWFWPVFLLLAVVLIILAIQTIKSIGWRGAAPQFLALAGAAAQCIGLSNWFAPFGWVGWGPRLMIPTVVGFVVASVVIIDSQVVSAKVRKLRSYSVLNIAVITCAIGSVIAAVGFLRDPGSTLAWFGRVSPTCPTPAVIQQDSAYYFRCLSYGMWNFDRPIIQLSIQTFSGRWSVVALAAVFLVGNQLVRSKSPGSGIGDIQRGKNHTEHHHTQC